MFFKSKPQTRTKPNHDSLNYLDKLKEQEKMYEKFSYDIVIVFNSGESLSFKDQDFKVYRNLSSKWAIGAGRIAVIINDNDYCIDLTKVNFINTVIKNR